MSDVDTGDVTLACNADDVTGYEDLIKTLTEVSEEVHSLPPIEQVEHFIETIKDNPEGVGVLAMMIADQCRIIGYMEAGVPVRTWDPTLVVMKRLSIEMAREFAQHDAGTE